MQLHELSATGLFSELFDQDQEVITGGDTWTAQQLQGFLNNTFYLIGKYGGYYNGFDYNGFFKSLEKYGFYGPDISLPNGGKK